ncbi:MAG TPA: hypothetical protein PK002_06130 [Cellvibrio sp.]|nr:hypothetical protein [Cellvibrio sp.]
MKKILTVISLLALSALGLIGCSDSLVSDEKMIENFKSNRPAFQELVASYYKDGQKQITWRAIPRVIELKRITGVENISDGPGYWFENPYSLEAAEKLKKMLDEKLWDQFNDRKSLIIKMPEAKGYGEYTLYYGNQWKDYFYYPEDPRIENGHLVLPRQPNGPAEFQGDEVLESLNSFPQRKNWLCFKKNRTALVYKSLLYSLIKPLENFKEESMKLGKAQFLMDFFLTVSHAEFLLAANLGVYG